MQVLVNLSSRDKSYQGVLMQRFKELGLRGKVTSKALNLEALLSLARKIKANAIYCCNQSTLQHIVPETTPSLETWRGSVLQTSIPIVIGLPLFNIHARKAGKFLFHTDTNKIKSAILGDVYKYQYNIATDSASLTLIKHQLIKAFCLVIDIETSLDNKITSVSFTEIKKNNTIGYTWVISLLPKHYKDISEVEQAWEIVKTLCENDSIKVFHNGTFDCFQLMRYHIVVNNYIYDTEYIFHCWYCELQKGLDRVASFLLPDFYYWKYEAEINPLEYNAKDTINTARIISILWRTAPNWVWTNYCQLMPNIFTGIRIQFEGLLIDLEKRDKAKLEAQTELDKELDRLRTRIGLPSFNPGSPKQVHYLIYKLLKAKRPPRAKSKMATGELELTKVARQHPLFSIIISSILSYRENKKAITTYYNAQLTEANRLLYAPRIDGAETLRQSYKASSLRYCLPGKNLVKSNVKNLGTQLQNIPYYYKKAIKADPGYLLGNIDKAQSEARCTAYLSGCESLRLALENPPETAGVKDFYCYTGYKFFGIEFDKEHILRQVVKKIIHGTNYLMGIDTFIDSVGLENMQEYKRIIGYKGNLRSFARHLLSLYHMLYPEVSENWEKTKLEVAKTGKVITPDGWVRIVFGNIAKDHAVLRSIVAHLSQHFSVVGINEALWRAWLDIQIPSNGEFRLKGQIHDSIIYQAIEEKFDYYTDRLVEIMDIPQSTPSGILRIPLDRESGVYWKS